jgi:hypothetical protein
LAFAGEWAEPQKSQPVLLARVGTKKPPLAGGGKKRRRPDSNRGWRICNQTPSNPNLKSDKELRDQDIDGSAFGAALQSEIGVADPDLALVINQWKGLPKTVKAGILAMIRAAVAE